MRFFTQNFLEEALTMLGQLLLDRNERYEVVVIGGGGLLLLGLISRPTRDFDLVACVNEGQLVTATPLPKSLLTAIKEVGIALGCGESWMNSEPSHLFEMGLPAGFQTRWITKQYGGLTIHLASRFDQICFKLYAAVDQEPGNKHFSDLKLLKPNKTELEKAENWCKTHDVSEGFAILIQDVKMRLGG